MYWELDYLGQPVNRRKQIYAQAFTIYAVAEYYKYCKKTEVLAWAMELFQLIETHALDHDYEGYTEAFAENWDAIEDMRLSEKDFNAPKTMNTHLHILEAYTTLYEVNQDPKIHHAFENLIELQGEAKGDLRIMDRGDTVRAEPLRHGTELGLYILSKP